MKKNEFLEYVHLYHRKNFITYHKTSEKLYKWLKAIYILAFIYQFFINLVLIWNMVVVPSHRPLESNILTNTIIATALLAVAFVIMFFKLGIFSFALNVISVIFEMTLMVPGLILTSGAVDVSGAFYWQYAIPMTIILILSLWMGIIATREWYIVRRDAKLLDNALYEEFGEEYSSLTPKQIKHFVNTYDPYTQKETGIPV